MVDYQVIVKLVMVDSLFQISNYNEGKAFRPFMRQRDN
jgi:hypothetical protein